MGVANSKVTECFNFSFLSSLEDTFFFIALEKGEGKEEVREKKKDVT